MKIKFRAYVKRKISLSMSKFPDLLEAHLEKVQETKEIEEVGNLLKINNFNDWKKTSNFI